MKNGKPNTIRSLRELEQARLSVNRRLYKTRGHMNRDVKRIFKFFKPYNLAENGWSLVAPSSRPLNSILLGVVRRLKARMKSK